MNIADRIKKTEKWTPAVKPQPADSRNEQIGQWAAQVAVTADPSRAFEDATTQSSSSRYSPSSALALNDYVHTTPGKSSSSSVSRFVRLAGSSSMHSSIKEAVHKSSILLVDRSDDVHSVNKTSAIADSSHEDSPNTKTGNASHAEDVSDRGVTSSSQPFSSSPLSQPTLSKIGKLALSPATVPHSQIHRLREPVSTRKLPARESIILLKASTVNGFKFPPWDKNPSADEFVPRDGVDHYT